MTSLNEIIGSMMLQLCYIPFFFYSCMFISSLWLVTLSDNLENLVYILLSAGRKLSETVCGFELYVIAQLDYKTVLTRTSWNSLLCW